MQTYKVMYLKWTGKGGNYGEYGQNYGEYGEYGKNYGEYLPFEGYCL